VTFPPEALDRFDRETFLAINGWLHGLDTEGVEVLLRLSNEVGNAALLVPITALYVLLGRLGWFGFARMVGLYAAPGLAGWCASILKHEIGRPRPHLALAEQFARGDCSTAWGEAQRLHGFPSGHAATVAAIAVVLASWAMAWPEPWRRRVAIAMLVLGMLLVGLARVYAGAHYPLDVLGGYLLGIVFGWIGVGLTRLLTPRPAPGGLR
jgi:membrane-associated phospholipid phosphatase